MTRKSRPYKARNLLTAPHREDGRTGEAHKNAIRDGDRRRCASPLASLLVAGALCPTDQTRNFLEIRIYYLFNLPQWKKRRLSSAACKLKVGHPARSFFSSFLAKGQGYLATSEMEIARHTAFGNAFVSENEHSRF